ncbi:TrmH family RNA methyltransferase [Candidatus Berkelbacteria bacterium]|nr:TrmH family RNA methyltransferase [Candidatus Berkelbacteria bacterium]
MSRPPHKRRVVAILENVRSLYNVGAAFRTADGFGLEHLYLSGFTAGPDGLNDPVVRGRVAKTALGAENTVPWTKFDNHLTIVDQLKRGGWTVLALEQAPSAVSLFTFHVSPPLRIALVVGNELHGVTESTLRLADHVVQIPMLGQKESLNAAVAFGIACAWLRWGQYE